MFLNFAVNDTFAFVCVYVERESNCNKMLAFGDSQYRVSGNSCTIFATSP